MNTFSPKTLENVRNFQSNCWHESTRRDRKRHCGQAAETANIAGGPREQHIEVNVKGRR